MSRDIAASARARLKAHADEHREDFNLTLIRYGLERLLYRLAVSRHADAFLLKGALLFSLWYGHSHRPTRDADLPRDAKASSNSGGADRRICAKSEDADAVEGFSEEEPAGSARSF